MLVSLSSVLFSQSLLEGVLMEQAVRENEHVHVNVGNSVPGAAPGPVDSRLGRSRRQLPKAVSWLGRGSPPFPRRKPPSES